MTLKQKLLSPVVIGILILGSIGYIIMSLELSKLETQVTREFVTSKQEEIYTVLGLAAEQAKEQAALFTRLPEVLTAFEIAHQGDINRETDSKGQQAREMLRQALQAHLDGYAAVMNENALKLHFHLPNGRSLARMWREKQTLRHGAWLDISDDISEFRQTVLDVNRTGNPVSGIEIGRGGFVIRGLAPVKTPEGKQLGSVEVLVDVPPLLERLAQREILNGEQRLVLFMNSEFLPITTNLRDSEIYPLFGDAYVQVYATGGEFDGNSVGMDLLNRGRQTISFEMRDDALLGAFPVNDYKQQQIGVLFYRVTLTAERALIREILWSLIGMFLSILCVLGVIMVVITRRFILRPLQRIVLFAEEIKGGNYQATLDVQGNDKIGEMGVALNHMVLTQRQTIDQIQRSTIQVTSSSTELSATAKQQEATMQNQVESTKKVLVSVEEISDVVGDLAHTMGHVAVIAQGTTESVGTGKRDLDSMKEAMAQMANASKSISGRLETINEKAENITTVVTTIAKVADQTNLLSLNAAIEAEKAGEFGQGFTVVAREIRRLADRTAMATLDIEQMVKEMQTAVSAGVMEVDKFIAQVQQSTEDVGEVSLQLSGIIDQVQMLTPNFELVNESMKHQSENAQNIKKSMLLLHEETQETKEALHETYSAIGQLNEAARDLQDEVVRFRLT